MPLIQPATGTTLDILTRLKALLEADSQVAGVYTGPIRLYPPDNVTATDDVIVTLHTPDEDYSPETMQSVRVAPRVLLTILVHEPQQNADVEAIYKRLVSLTTLFRDRIWHYRRDPTPGDNCYWYAVKFHQGPTTAYAREPQQYQRSRTQFDMKRQKGNP
jgi:hypothetical protein